MPETVRENSQDFWRPAQTSRLGMDSVFPAACCANCGTEFAIGARFCHVCGANREPDPEPQSQFAEWLDIDVIREKLGLNLASLILFFVAAGCALGAILTGVIYSAATALEWQAVQTWRIEWMLAAITCLLGALLLKKPAQ